jgi:hypothetical protein
MKKKSNYFKLGLIIVVVILATIISCNLYKNYEGRKTNSSYISKYVSSIKYDDLKSAVIEFGSNSFVYISYIGNKNIYNMEIDLRKVVDKNNLNDNFTYVDATKQMFNSSYLDNLNNMLGLKDKKIKALPAIVYFNNSKVVDFIDSSDSLINASDFKKMLDAYELTGTQK